MNLSIVIPAYNEAENLPGILEDMAAFVYDAPCPVQVVVVDDGSTDETAEILDREGGRLDWLDAVTLETNSGMGAALKAGTARCVHPLVAWVMADRSDRLADIQEMRRKLMNGADIVVGSRAIPGGDYGHRGGIKAAGSRMLSAFLRVLLDLPVHDVTNAYRAFHRDLLESLRLERDDFGISLEMILRAVAMGKCVEEVPTTYTYRERGVSHFPCFQMGFLYLCLAIQVKRNAP